MNFKSLNLFKPSIVAALVGTAFIGSSLPFANEVSAQTTQKCSMFVHMAVDGDDGTQGSITGTLNVEYVQFGTNYVAESANFVGPVQMLNFRSGVPGVISGSDVQIPASNGFLATLGSGAKGLNLQVVATLFPCSGTSDVDTSKSNLSGLGDFGDITYTIKSGLVTRTPVSN